MGFGSGVGLELELAPWLVVGLTFRVSIGVGPRVRVSVIIRV